MSKPHLTIILANPRGFCAGVERAIEIVERALEKFGAPVYVRHEIVHNRYVVEELEAKGAIFVEELNEVPNDVPVIFSASRRSQACAGRRPSSATCSMSMQPVPWSVRSIVKPSDIFAKAVRSC